jgi:hypothetical protein
LGEKTHAQYNKGALIYDKNHRLNRHNGYNKVVIYSKRRKYVKGKSRRCIGEGETITSSEWIFNGFLFKKSNRFFFARF